MSQVSENITGVAKHTVSGQVVRISSPTTIKVLVERSVVHPIYKKVISRRKKYTVHDPKQLAKAGDRVEIRECAPVSKTKKWTLDKIVARIDD